MPVTPLAFMRQFTAQTRQGIIAAGQQSPAIADWYNMLLAASEVDPNDPDLQAGMAGMVQIGLVSPEDSARVMGWLAEQTAIPPKPPAPTIDTAAMRVERFGSEKDGRFYATFVFPLSDGSVRSQPVLLDAGTDADAELQKRAALLAADLATGG